MVDCFFAAFPLLVFVPQLCPALLFPPTQMVSLFSLQLIKQGPAAVGWGASDLFGLNIQEICVVFTLLTCFRAAQQSTGTVPRNRASTGNSAMSPNDTRPPKPLVFRKQQREQREPIFCSNNILRLSLVRPLTALTALSAHQPNPSATRFTSESPVEQGPHQPCQLYRHITGPATRDTPPAPCQPPHSYNSPAVLKVP